MSGGNERFLCTAGGGVVSAEGEDMGEMVIGGTLDKFWGEELLGDGAVVIWGRSCFQLLRVLAAVSGSESCRTTWGELDELA